MICRDVKWRIRELKGNEVEGVIEGRNQVCQVLQKHTHSRRTEDKKTIIRLLNPFFGIHTT